MNRDTFLGLRDSLLAFWQERDQRERKILLLAAAFLLLVLIYLLLLNPPLTGRAQLDKTLPVLRQQNAEMQGLAAQAGVLAKQPAPALEAVSKDSITAALTRHALKAQNIVQTGELTKVQFSEASFAAIITWLVDMQSVARLSVVEANIEALPAVDRVNATLTLRQQGGESVK